MSNCSNCNYVVIMLDWKSCQSIERSDGIQTDAGHVSSSLDISSLEYT